MKTCAKCWRELSLENFLASNSSKDGLMGSCRECEAARRRDRGRTHRTASRIAFESDCLVCGATPCEPCHYPTHRGMGGAKAGWTNAEWVPLCRYHHDLVDGRLGVSPFIEEQRRLAKETIDAHRSGAQRPE